MRGVVSGVMGVIGVIDVVEGAGEMRPERNPFVKLARKDVGAEELPLSLDGDMIILYVLEIPFVQRSGSTWQRYLREHLSPKIDSSCCTHHSFYLLPTKQP